MSVSALRSRAVWCRMRAFPADVQLRPLLLSSLRFLFHGHFSHILPSDRVFGVQTRLSSHKEAQTRPTDQQLLSWSASRCHFPLQFLPWAKFRSYFRFLSFKIISFCPSPMIRNRPGPFSLRSPASRKESEAPGTFHSFRMYQKQFRDRSFSLLKYDSKSQFHTRIALSFDQIFV